MLHQEVEFPLGLPAIDAGLELSEHIQPESTAILGPIRTPDELIHPQGNPHVGAQAGLAPLKIRRSNSNDGVQAMVNLNRPANDRGVGSKARAPHSLADYSHRWSSA